MPILLNLGIINKLMNYNIYSRLHLHLHKELHYNKQFLYNGTSICNNFCQNYDSNKIIAISPGGYKGFYQLGIASYIKDNYKLDNYYFSGASAGAWVSLFMVYKGNHNIFIKDLIDFMNNIKSKRLDFIQNQLKIHFLTKYKTNEFDLSRIFIGVVQFDKIYKMPYLNIYTNFQSLEDAIDCCIVSSHIPFITGGLIKKYNNKISFDGGFSNYPYLKINNLSIVLNIHPKLWIYSDYKKQKPSPNNLSKIYNFDIYDFTNLFSIDNFNLSQMYYNGYKDSQKNKYLLDLSLSPL
jgi:hypothetical protein